MQIYNGQKKNRTVARCIKAIQKKKQFRWGMIFEVIQIVLSGEILAFSLLKHVILMNTK